MSDAAVAEVSNDSVAPQDSSVVNPDVDYSVASEPDEIQQAIDAVMGENDGDSPSVDKAAPKEEPKPKREDADKPKASAWASFNKQKKDFESQRQQFAQEREELTRVKGILENAKHDRLAALEAMGYTDLKEFIQSVADDGGRITPERQKILELEKKMAERERQETEQRQQWEQQQHQNAQRQQLDALHNQVVQTIKENYNDQLVAIDGSSQAVMQEMDRLAGENGVMPDISEAIENIQKQQEARFAQILENPRAQALAMQILKSSKIAQHPASSKKAPIKTISGAVTSGTRSDRKDYVPSRSGDAEVEEAIAWLNTQQRSRR